MGKKKANVVGPEFTKCGPYEVHLFHPVGYPLDIPGMFLKGMDLIIHLTKGADYDCKLKSLHKFAIEKEVVMDKTNKPISEKSHQLKPKVTPEIVRRLAAQQTVDLVKVHEAIIKKASPAAWDKMEVLFERLKQYESEIHETNRNIKIDLKRVPLETVRKYVVNLISEMVETVTCYVNTVNRERRPPSKIQIMAIKVLLSISRCYLDSLKSGV